MDVGDRMELIGPGTPGLPAEHGLHNVNGPCLVAVPEWADGLGRFHLYFAHHVGHTIRLAFADELTGPWTLHPAGALHVDDTPATGDFPHVASPDVHVDHDRRRFVLYAHAPVPEQVAGHLPSWGRYPSLDQHTVTATSADGVRFEPCDPPVAIGPSYLRAFRWRGRWYGLAMPGQLLCTTDGRDPADGATVEYGPDLFDDPEIRHSAVHVEGDTLHVWFSHVGDAPERILWTTVALSDDWHAWTPTEPREVARPSAPWEGVELPVVPSVRGAALDARHELRDPFVFDHDGARFLLYSAAAETAIGLTRLS